MKLWQEAVKADGTEIRVTDMRRGVKVRAGADRVNGRTYMRKDASGRADADDRIGKADVVIVGGGASGMTAAVELGTSSPELSVVIIEKNDAPGRKLRATGSGRCNITNTFAEGYEEILRFFGKIGLMTRAYENGLVYPYSESAADVAELLSSRVRDSGTQIITDAEVTNIEFTEGSGFTVRYVSGGCPNIIKAGRVILAMGGKAGSAYGTTGDGYRIAKELGHTIVTPVPILTSVECEEWREDRKPCGINLAGTRTRGVVNLYRKDPRGESKIFEESGEIQFTRFGISGICVFNMTRHMRYDRSAGESLGDFVVSLDLFPDGDIRNFLRDRRERAFTAERAAEALKTVLKENIAAYVMSCAGIGCTDGDGGKEMRLSELTEDEICRIGDAVHSLTFHPSALRGWKEAQATSGGVSLGEVDPDTTESLVVPGLYITGELADRDFGCGGFNLSNAWMTGLKAARAAAKER